MTLGQQISLLRKQKNMSQEDLAAAMEVSRQAVSKWETGLCSPDTENLIRLASLLEVDVNVLVGTPEAPAPTVPKKSISLPVLALSILLVIALCAAAVFALLWQGEKRANAAAQADGTVTTYQNVTFIDWTGLEEKRVELTAKEQEDLAQYITSFHFTKRPDGVRDSIFYGGRSYQVTFDKDGTHYDYRFTVNGFRVCITFRDGQTVEHLYEVDYVLFYYLDALMR